MLPIALGEATKLCGRMLDASKEYEFTVAFGVETDTLDLEGKVVAESAGRRSTKKHLSTMPVAASAQTIPNSVQPQPPRSTPSVNGV